MSDVTIHVGDCIEQMRNIPDESIDTVITSPPYWGLRDYGNDAQLGLEQTVDEYITNMVKVFDEVKRILKPQGTLWLNIGDSYNGSGGSGGDYNEGGIKEGQPKYGKKNTPNLKPKDLVGIPWRLAFALQESGWWLRQDIIWAKPNCMPESVKDRCTKNHEYLFLLTKSANYYYDNEAIKEPVADATRTNYQSGSRPNGENKDRQDNDMASRSKDVVYTTRNKRSVWWVGPKPFKGAHFAVFPIELIEPCVLAGTSEHGCCSECGAPWKRVVKRKGTEQDSTLQQFKGMEIKHANPKRGGQRANANGTVPSYIPSSYDTMGWKPTCDCGTTDTIPAVVFDPFGGSGTTAIAAIKHGRKAILTELNPDYVKIAEKRISDFKQEVGLNKNEVEWV